MSLKSKVLNIKHSFKYKNFQFFKFYIFKEKYKKNREVALNLLKEDLSVIELDKKFLENKFPYAYDDFKKINDDAMKKFLDISKKKECKASRCAISRIALYNTKNNKSNESTRNWGMARTVYKFNSCFRYKK